jgi:hypothetical protein
MKGPVIALALVAGSSPAIACITPPVATIRSSSSVIAQGTFFVSDETAGAGYIIPKRVDKGKRKKRYEVRWDPDERESLQPHEFDCMVEIPRSESFELFYLTRNLDQTFSIIGRARRVESKN